MMLEDKVALVTGASRGVGKGIAKQLAELGATVYITGRQCQTHHPDESSPRSVMDTAAEIQKSGGTCIPLFCDHSNAEDIATVFNIIQEQTGRLDILVNNAWGGYEAMHENIGGRSVFTWPLPFWKQPLWRFDTMMESVRSNFICSQFAATMMQLTNSGLIVHISYWAAEKYMANVPYGVAKSAVNRMSSDMAVELNRSGICSMVLYPGLVRTEGIMKSRSYFDLSNSESPEFQGLAIAHVFNDPNYLRFSGSVVTSAELALLYHFKDIDGQQPYPQSYQTCL
ncbi:MAG: SDR family NAD(P)-dependent oxidoreductase [Bacteroidetes bacterium]|nr:SDR family NAD(P)-dependent oxidoreductase [Bacteroidota bacterium]